MRVIQGYVADRLVGDDGRSVVLVGQLALVVSPVATVLFEVLEDQGEADIETLAAALVEAFGSPPGRSGVELTRELCRDLERTGAIRVVTSG